MIASRRALIPPSAVNSLAGLDVHHRFSRPNLVAIFLSSVMQYLMYTCSFSQTIPLLRIHERLIVYFQLIDQHRS